MSYQPLPDCLTIKESSIHGLGLFATKDIPVFIDFTDSSISYMTQPITELGTTHVLVDKKIYRTPLGGFINHSTNPNTKLVIFQGYHKSHEVCALYPTRDIKEGEEITLDYTKELCGLSGYKNEEWLK